LKFFSIIKLTFRESFAKKTFIAFMSISTLIGLLFIFALNLDIVDGAQSAVSLFGIDAPELVNVQDIIEGVEGAVSVLLFTAGIFMSLFATSSLIPALLQPGYVDLLITKPLGRMEILSARFIGAVAIVLFNIFYLILLTWLIMSIKTGLWNWGFLLSGIIIVITFTILYSLMTFLSMLSGSGPFSLMITYLILFFSPILLQRDNIYALLSSKYYGYFVDGLYYFLPKTAELGNITQQLARNVTVSSWMPLWTSLLFGILMFALSGLIFQKKDF